MSGLIKRILIIEDSPTERYLLERILAPRYAVEAHECAEHGLAALARPGPVIDLVLMDIILPGMDGFAATRTICRDPKTSGIPVVLCTTKSGEADIHWGLRQGACWHIAKPIHGPRLLSVLHAILGA